MFSMGMLLNGSNYLGLNSTPLVVYETHLDALIPQEDTHDRRTEGVKKKKNLIDSVRRESRKQTER